LCNQLGGRAADLLQVERFLGLNLITRFQKRAFVLGRINRDELIAQEADLFDRKPGVGVDLVFLIDLQMNGNPTAILGHVGLHNVADGHAGIENCGPLFQAADTRGLEPKVIAGRKDV
jgi:hypothetical protein